MAAGFSHLTIVGHVGRAPEKKEFETGSKVQFSVAVSGRKDQDSTWYSVNVYGKLGDTSMQYVNKGMKVLVSGDFAPRTYTDRNGNSRISYDINADHVQFLSAKGETKQQDNEEVDLPF